MVLKRTAAGETVTMKVNRRLVSRSLQMRQSTGIPRATGT